MEYKSFFDNNPFPCLLCGHSDGRAEVLSVNSAFETFFGHPSNDFIGQKTGIPSGQIMLSELLDSKNAADYAAEVFHLSHDVFAVIITAYGSGESHQKSLAEASFFSLGEAALSVDEKNSVVLANTAAEKLLGIPSVSISGRSMDEVLEIWDQYGLSFTDKICKADPDSETESCFSGLFMRNRYNNEQFPVEVKVSAVKTASGKREGKVIVIRDYSESKAKHDEMIYLSYHDQLTGLYNRRFFEEELKRLDTSRNLPISILMADMNGLKLTNDSFGHTVGDELIQKAAKVIKSCCRSDDIVARYGGDEFIILLPKTGYEDARHIVNRIKESEKKEKAGVIEVSISVGFDTKDSADEQLSAIIDSAETNMYRQKYFESLSTKNRTLDLILNSLYQKSTKDLLHSKRVSDLCASTAIQMGLDCEQISGIKFAALLHGAGKLASNRTIINNLNSLSENEWESMKKSPDLGSKLLIAVNEIEDTADTMLSCKNLRHGINHESIESRLIEMACAYEKMISGTDEKAACSEVEALEILESDESGRYECELLTAFRKAVSG